MRVLRGHAARRRCRRHPRRAPRQRRRARFHRRRARDVGHHGAGRPHHRPGLLGRLGRGDGRAPASRGAGVHALRRAHPGRRGGRREAARAPLRRRRGRTRGHRRLRRQVAPPARGAQRAPGPRPHRAGIGRGHRPEPSPRTGLRAADRAARGPVRPRGPRRPRRPDRRHRRQPLHDLDHRADRAGGAAGHRNARRGRAPAGAARGRPGRGAGPVRRHPAARPGRGRGPPAAAAPPAACGGRQPHDGAEPQQQRRPARGEDLAGPRLDPERDAPARRARLVPGRALGPDQPGRTGRSGPARLRGVLDLPRQHAVHAAHGGRRGHRLGAADRPRLVLRTDERRIRDSVAQAARCWPTCATSPSPRPGPRPTR